VMGDRTTGNSREACMFSTVWGDEKLAPDT
jgi:hypothetical protein